MVEMRSINSRRVDDSLSGPRGELPKVLGLLASSSTYCDGQVSQVSIRQEGRQSKVAFPHKHAPLHSFDALTCCSRTFDNFLSSPARLPARGGVARASVTTFERPAYSLIFAGFNEASSLVLRVY